MTLISWLNEFYPVEIDDLDSDQKAYLEHSIRKWTGLRPENLAKHGMEFEKDGGWIEEIDMPMQIFWIDASTCALCRAYQESSNDCTICPLYALLDSRCDQDEMPFSIWSETGDPEPMIKALVLLLDECILEQTAKPRVQVDRKVVLNGTFRCPECNFLEKHFAGCSLS